METLQQFAVHEMTRRDSAAQSRGQARAWPKNCFGMRTVVPNSRVSFEILQSTCPPAYEIDASESVPSNVEDFLGTNSRLSATPLPSP